MWPYNNTKGYFTTDLCRVKFQKRLNTMNLWQRHNRCAKFGYICVCQHQNKENGIRWSKSCLCNICLLNRTFSWMMLRLITISHVLYQFNSFMCICVHVHERARRQIVCFHVIVYSFDVFMWQNLRWQVSSPLLRERQRDRERERSVYMGNTSHICAGWEP